ncbi:MAG TPA: glycosyltransferase family 4 protein, partial [Pyrinomonadaceae bacterium]|nr:glycosyltransferase family 4 protein [Pyrinomonadaceae bacterium]
MHIAFVTTESPYGDGGACGIAAYLRAVIPALVDADHKVTLFAKAKDEKDFSAENGRVNVHHFRLPSLHWYAAKVPLIKSIAPLPMRQFEWSGTFYRRVARVGALTKIDVIESTETGSLFLHRIAPLVIRMHGSELTFRKHSGMPVNLNVRLNESLESAAAKHAAAITTPSRFQADEISKRRGWPPGRVQVIPNPISGELLRAASEFRRNGCAERIVLYTGRLAPVKGIDTLLEAAKLVSVKDSNITFVLAGPWQMPRAPEEYGLELNGKSANGILWVGPQSQPEIIEWYKRASLFVMPSNYETFGISAVEAIAFGLPAIVTETSGLAEVLGEEDLASFVPRRDPKALAEKINVLMSSRNGVRKNTDPVGVAIKRYRPE